MAWAASSCSGLWTVEGVLLAQQECHVGGLPIVCQGGVAQHLLMDWPIGSLSWRRGIGGVEQPKHLYQRQNNIES